MIGFIQLLATIKGVQVWTNLPWIVAMFLSFFIAYVPVLGTIAGIKGATDAWGWGLWPAIAFFCWPYALYFVAAAAGGLAALVFRRKGGVS